MSPGSGSAWTDADPGVIFLQCLRLGSGSIWTFLGSRTRIRIKTNADPKHWSFSVSRFLFFLSIFPPHCLFGMGWTISALLFLLHKLPRLTLFCFCYHYQDEFVAMEMRARRRSLGNIRFIGELYKLGMLTVRYPHIQCYGAGAGLLEWSRSQILKGAPAPHNLANLKQNVFFSLIFGKSYQYLEFVLRRIKN